MKELLYGHNPEQRIVAVQQFGDNKIKVFKRLFLIYIIQDKMKPGDGYKYLK